MAFLAVVLFSGAISGTIQGVANFVLVEPVLDRAIYLENKALFDSGAEQDSIEFRVAQEEYRLWQKGGQLISSNSWNVNWFAFWHYIQLCQKITPKL